MEDDLSDDAGCPQGAPPHGREPVDPDVDLDVARQRDELAAPHGGLVLAAVAVGGIVGAEARYGLGVAWPHPVGGWPWATMAINASGCLLIGVLMILITERFTPHPLLRPLLGVGVLGGYTTFSTFAVDGVTLVAQGHPLAAAVYLVTTPVVAMVTVAVGAALTRTALGRGGHAAEGTP